MNHTTTAAVNKTASPGAAATPISHYAEDEDEDVDADADAETAHAATAAHTTASLTPINYLWAPGRDRRHRTPPVTLNRLRHQHHHPRPHHRPHHPRHFKT